MEKDDLENALSKIEEKLHILICAKQQKQLDMDNQEYEIEAQKLSLCNTKKQDLEPERNLLGGQLKSYYSSLVLNQEQKAKCCHKNVELLKANEAEAKQTKSELEKAEKEIVSELGGIKASISGYDATEERYNHKYHTSLGRNILGIYEPGLFTVTNQQYRKQLEDAEHNRMTIRRSLEDNKDKFKNIQRTISDQENTKTAKKIACNAETEKLKTFDEEIRERKTILHYFNLGEEVLFDIEEILSQSARKIRETELARNALAIEANTLQKEFKRLTQGQVLELSEEFKKMLDEAGISYVYGMEWLLKNQNSVLENQKLVETHPFLPYALILSNQEIKRLQELQENVYTSFPVPILVRESLEKIMNPASSALRQFEGVSFYLWFNENLLDEDKLSVMVKEKELEIKKINESIKRKSNEYSEYFEKQERIRNQKVTKAAYEEVQNAISQLREQLQVLDQELTNKRTELENVEQTINEQEKSIHRLDEGILQQKQQLQDFEQLEVDYHKYEEYCSLLENKKKEQERIQNQQGLCEEKIQKLQSQIITIQNDINMLETDLKENREKQVKYEQYEPGEAALPEKIVDIENRYLAITSELSVEQQELEHRVEQAVNRRNSSMEELEHLATKYHLTSDMWEEIRYDRKEESHQEIDRENKLIKIKQRQNMINDERVILEGYKTKEQLKKEELKKQCGTEELLPREEIKTINFDAEIKEKNYQKKELEKQQNTIQKKIQGYEELMTALVEYEEFTCSNVITWEIDLSELTSKELTQQKGILIRDYNSYCSDINKKRADLERQLERVRQMEQFADAFYQKPIDTLLNLTADAALVLKQLETILQSFQSLMEKLLVDISFVEKERDKVVELMEEYIKEVHQELGKIDHNSTITIRDKAVKMLKIGLQEWEENESMYQLRLQDYIDDVTQKGVAILDENHNVAEFLGTRITTKALYDAVIGIANVQIRMYKIEAQREYPITWSDVAKNSGGEGFLSAFVILASLLYYMRKDDSDIFADRNEGKVLIMDNPFAQTNASHLLKPLMDMAKKTNTQLICLTGLGGESIYNRFDNIYVLTLIAANLRNGMQYLKSEHMRGSEEETMIVSKFEVMEQQELIF